MLFSLVLTSFLYAILIAHSSLAAVINWFCQAPAARVGASALGRCLVDPWAPRGPAFIQFSGNRRRGQHVLIVHHRTSAWGAPNVSGAHAHATAHLALTSR